MFDGKIGIWPFTVDSVAQRSSVNRLKGDPITKNIESIDRNVYKDYLIGKVIPAIKAKWPRGKYILSRNQTGIKIKQHFQEQFADPTRQLIADDGLKQPLTNPITAAELARSFKRLRNGRRALTHFPPS
ncbi:hypothetical protein KRP22_012953 [Phytophthora ramorum]|nr:hypothetical protein KRP22_8617 [Phytophthora ramorum]